mgnify:CR=1 FL=1
MLRYFKKIKKNKKMILDLAKNDFKTKYSGSYFGILWGIIQPIVSILVFWFVFEVGFRAKVDNNTPFVVWITAGLVPWFFFSEGLGNMTYSFIEYSYLVKKVMFDIEILPLIKLMSAFFIHCIFLILLLSLLIIHKIPISIYYIQIIYYSFATFMFTLSIGLFTSCIVPFFRDFGQIVQIFLQFGVWLSPIMWQISIIPKRYLGIFKLNPMYYIVEGFRNSIFYNIGFWNYPLQTIYFWFTVILLLKISFIIYRKLSPYFSDVI